MRITGYHIGLIAAAAFGAGMAAPRVDEGGDDIMQPTDEQHRVLLRVGGPSYLRSDSYSVAQADRHGMPHKHSREIERRLKQEARAAAKAR